MVIMTVINTYDTTYMICCTKCSIIITRGTTAFLGITFFRCPIYFWQTAGVSVNQIHLFHPSTPEYSLKTVTFTGGEPQPLVQISTFENVWGFMKNYLHTNVKPK